MKTFTMSLSQVDLRLLPICRPSAKSIQKMVATLKEQGQISPLILSKENILIDGFKRYTAAEKLGFNKINAMALDVDLVRAKVMTLTLNPKKQINVIQEAVLVRELVEKDGLAQTEVAIFLQKHKSWVNRRLALINSLAPEIIEDIQLELISPGSGQHLARLHTCNQADFSATIQQHGLKPNQVATLIDLWSKAKDSKVKQDILSSPQESLRVYHEQKKLHTLFQRLGKMLDSLEKDLDQDKDTKHILTLIKNKLSILKKRSLHESSK